MPIVLYIVWEDKVVNVNGFNKKIYQYNVQNLMKICCYDHLVYQCTVLKNNNPNCQILAIAFLLFSF